MLKNKNQKDNSNDNFCRHQVCQVVDKGKSYSYLLQAAPEDSGTVDGECLKASSSHSRSLP